MTNLSILQRNVLDSLENEEAKATFLKAQEQPKNDRFSYWAEGVAREVDHLASFLKVAIGHAARPFEAGNDVQSDLLDFILKRHWHSRVSE